MAQYEHLPIYQQAMKVAIHCEKVVAGFSRYHKGLLNISSSLAIDASGRQPPSVRGNVQKSMLSLTEGSVQQGRSHFGARSVLIVRERERRKAASL